MADSLPPRLRLLPRLAPRQVAARHACFTSLTLHTHVMPMPASCLSHGTAEVERMSFFHGHDATCFRGCVLSVVDE